jgi:hypothetical protein
MADIDTLTGEALEKEARAVYTRYAEANPALASRMGEITASNIKFLQNGKLGLEDLQIIRKYAKEAKLPVLEKIQVALENTAPSITNMAEHVLEEAAPVVAKKERGIARLFKNVKAKVSGLFSRETKAVAAPVVPAEQDHSRFMPKTEAVPEVVTAEAAVAEAGAHLLSFTPPSDVKREITTENGITFEKVVEAAENIGMAPAPIPAGHAGYVPEGTPIAVMEGKLSKKAAAIANQKARTGLAQMEARAVEAISPAAVEPEVVEVAEEVAASAAKTKGGGIIGWVKEKWNNLWAKDEQLLGAEQKAKEAKKLGRNAKKEAGATEKVLSEASHMSSGKKWAVGLTAAAAVSAWAAYAHEGKKMREAEQRAGRR